jgi:multidrug efflux pump subunit AcrB
MDILRSFVSNHVLATVVSLMLLVSGILAGGAMRRESLPAIDVGMIQVVVGYPGANPKEVEEGISRLIEPRLDGLEGVKSYSTNSVEGAGMAMVEIDYGQDPQELKERVTEAIDGITNFPEESLEPRITILKREEEVINVALWGELPERQMKAWAERVRSELVALPELSLAFVQDTRNYEINIDVSRSKLSELGLSLAQVSAAIQRSSLDMSTGVLRADGEEISIRAVGRRYDGAELEAVVIKATPDGSIVTLGQVAEIRDAFGDQAAFGSFNGKPAVMVEVYKAEGEDIITISDAVKRYAEAEQATLAPGLHITPCFDESEFVRNQISLLLWNGVFGMALVLFTLWLFLSARLAFWVALGVPVSVCGSLVLLWATGATINQITLMSFILVLGILVDDAIVVGESVFHHRALGKNSLRAAADGVAEVGWPVVAAVFTTVVAFVPGRWIPGFLGQMMAIVPVVVISCLLVSLVEALFLLPAHLNSLPDVSREKRLTGWRRWLDPHRDVSDWLDRWVDKYYRPIMPHVLRHRYVTACVAFAVLLGSMGLITSGMVRVVFWPPVDGDVMAAVIEFPPGTPYEQVQQALTETREGLERVASGMKSLTGEPVVENVHERIFQGTPHMGRVFAEFIPPSRRGVPLEQMSVAWEKEVGEIPGAVAQQYYRSSIGGGGPQISVWLSSPDMEDLLDASGKLRERLKTAKGVSQVEDDFRPGRTEVQVELKPEAASLGVTMADLARHLNDGFYGAEAQRLQRGRDEVRVLVRYPLDERRNLVDLERSRIRTATGAEVPLTAVANFTLDEGYADIRGSNGLRRIAVFAQADSAVTSPETVVSELEESGYLDELVASYPGMHWRIRGQVEEQAQTLGGIKKGFYIAIFAIFVVMAVIFRSYAQPFVILLVVPFGLVGAILGHMFIGIPITMLSLFGLVALAGVVVNDAIVFVECVNWGIARGEPFYRAVELAGVRRFRPIMLTTVTTFAGLTPIILEKDLEAQMVIPMCVSVAFGVAFATIITLVIQPAFLAILNDLRRVVYYLRKGVWPTPEEVEPGAERNRYEEAFGSDAESGDEAAHYAPMP